MAFFSINSLILTIIRRGYIKEIVLPLSQIKIPSLTFALPQKVIVNIIDGEEQNLFTLARYGPYGTLIMSRKGKGTLDLRHPKRKVETLVSGGIYK